MLCATSYSRRRSQFGDLAAQHFLEGLARAVGEHLAVGPRVVGGRVHRGQVGLAFGRVERRADQLAVGQLEAVLLRRALERLDVVGRDLVTQPAAAAVDLKHDLPLAQAK